MRLILFFLFVPFYVYSQVSNDSIAHRKALIKGVPTLSNTSHCTVEWKCVDESLTGKCIEYHNDQWFSFYSRKEETLFVNVSKQQCKDLLGVQLVVLKGTPCLVSTYQIKSCVSLKSQDDFYIEIPFEKDQEYLLNIDGYLNDFCSFWISIDSISKGFPVIINLPIESKSEQQKNLIKIQWTLNDSLAGKINRFEVFERKDKEFKHQFKASIPLQRGSHHNITNENYTFTDTLKDHDKHYYKLIAIDNEDKKLLIKEYQFRFKPTQQELLKVSLKYKNNTPLSLIVWNEHRTQILQKSEFTSSKRISELYLDVTQWKEQGYKDVIIEITNQNTKQKTVEKHKL